MKHRPVLLLVLAAVLVAPMPTARSPVQEAGEAAAAAKLPAASEIFTRFITVTNLTAKVKETTSVRARGTVEMAAMGLEGPFEALSARPSFQRVEMDLGGMGTIRQGFDGEHGWAIVPFQGPRLMEGPELLLARLEAAYDEPLKPAALYEDVATVGRETFEETECHVVRLVARPLEGMDPEETREYRTIREFYAVESGLLMGKKLLTSSPMGDVPITVVLRDYRKFGEVLLAATTVQKLPGGDLEVRLSEVTFDGVPAERFALPPEIAELAAKKGK